MIKNPLKLYNYYIKEKENLANEKLTNKKYNELRRIETKLKKYGLLPLTYFDIIYLKTMNK